MKRNILVAVIIILIAIAGTAVLYKTQNPKTVITNFEECATTGNPIMESYPRQCRAQGQTFVEQIKNEPIENKETLCDPSQRNAEVCAEIYAPVCATVEIQCIRAPCNPIKQTFGNTCEACRNSLIKSYTAGECAK